MKKISFAYLDEYEKTLIKSMIKLMDKNKLFTILDDFDINDEQKKIVFVNTDDRRSHYLLREQQKNMIL